MCTRVIYTPKENQSYVGRNMDWAENPMPQLWVMPPKVKRKAMAKTERGQEFTWKSKYSSVIVSNFDISNTDGINSKGLTVNLLFLSSSEYPDGPHHEDAYPISMSIWAQYILDKCKTVEKAVYAMKNIYVQTTIIPDSGGKLATCHLSVGDKEGNSAVFEYIKGHLHIYTNVDTSGEKYKNYPHCIKHFSQDQMRVMTNDPKFDTQIGSLVYWDQLNDLYKNDKNPALLPGSNWSLSRFVRATYFTRQLPVNIDSTLALAKLAAIISNAAQPGTKLESLDSADLSKTQYSSFADQAKLQYFFRSAYGPFLIWINLSDVNFDKLKGKKGYAYKLQLNEDGVFQDCNTGYMSGKMNEYLKIEKMFDFLPIP